MSASTEADIVSAEEQTFGSVTPLFAEGSLTPVPLVVSAGPGGVVWLGDAALDRAGAHDLASLLLQAARRLREQDDIDRLHAGAVGCV